MKQTQWGDIVSSIANIFFASKGAPSMFSSRSKKERELQKAEARDKQKEEHWRENAERAERRLQQSADRLAANKDWRERKLEYRQQRDEKSDAYNRERFTYRKRKDWIADFYRRNAIYMKTGHRVPANFDKLVE